MGVSTTIAIVAVATTYRVLYWWRQQCNQISNGCLEIFEKIITLLTVTVLFYLLFSIWSWMHLISQQPSKTGVWDPAASISWCPKRQQLLSDNTGVVFIYHCQRSTIIFLILYKDSSLYPTVSKSQQPLPDDVQEPAASTRWCPRASSLYLTMSKSQQPLSDCVQEPAASTRRCSRARQPLPDGVQEPAASTRRCPRASSLYPTVSKGPAASTRRCPRVSNI